MKKKLTKLLLLLAVMIVGSGTSWAQTDVTSTFLSNTNFASNDGWDPYVSDGAYKDYGMYAIGGEQSVRFSAPTVDATHQNNMYAAGFECRWSGNYASYTQTSSAALPAGVYTLTYDVENVNGNTQRAHYNNLFYVKVGENTFTDTKTEWMKGGSSWTKHKIVFTLTESSSITVSIGYGTGTNNIDSKNTPAIYVSNMSLLEGEISYPISNLTAEGWSKITSISQADIANNYYIFLSEDEKLMLGLENSIDQSTKAAFYQDLADPATDATKIWTLEKNGDNYAMRNLSYTDLQLQTEWSSSNNDLRWRTNDQANSISWTGLAINAIPEGKFTLTSTQYNRPLGIYNNVTGTPVEGNEIGANNAGNGQNFQIYAISKSMLAPLANAAYYLYNVETGLFLSRGAAYGTAAWADNFGIPVKLIANEGGYRLQWIDQRDQYVSDNEWSWADGGTNRAQTYTLSVVEDGYKLVNKAHGESNLTLYVNSSSDGGQFTHQIASNGSYDIGGENIGNTWQFLTIAEHDAIVAQKKAEAEAAIATQRGYQLTGTQTLKELVEDADNFAAVDKTSSVTNAALINTLDGWTYAKKNSGGDPGVKDGNGIEVFQGCGTFSQTVTELPNGIYKVTVSGYYRDGSNAICTDNNNKGFIVSNAYLEANGNQTMIADWASDRSSDSEPNSPAAGKALFDAGKYLNEVYALVTDGSLTISIAQPGGATTNRWFLFSNVTLTYYNDQVSDEDAQAIIQEATNKSAEPMNNDVKNALTSAKSDFNANKNIPYYNALSTAITNAETSIANYAEAKGIIDAANEFDEAGKNAYAANETVAAIKAAYDAGTLEAVTDEQKTACATALTNAFMATITKATFAGGQKYLLKNIASGKYLSAGNDWGTQASLVANAEYNTLVLAGEGIYHIDSQVSNGGDSHFFNGSYMDSGATGINIYKKSSGEYILTNGTAVYGWDGTSTILASNLAITSDKALWEIVSIEDAIADFANATEQDPKDATFLIEDHNFGRNNRNFGEWKGTGLGKGGNYNNNSNMIAERYMNTFDTYQEFSNIPNGTYKLEAQAAVTYHDDRTIKEYDGQGAPVVYADDQTSDFITMEVADRLTNLNKLSEACSNNKYNVEPIIVKVINNTLKIGARSNRADIWAVVDNFRLTYLGSIAEATNVAELATSAGAPVILKAEGLEILNKDADNNIAVQEVGAQPVGILIKGAGNVNGVSSAEYGKGANALLLGAYNADTHEFTVEDHSSNRISVTGDKATVNDMTIGAAAVKENTYLLVKVENATITEEGGEFFANDDNNGKIKIDKRLDQNIKVNDGDLAYEITGITFMDGDVCVLAPLSKEAIVDNKAEASEGDEYDQGDNITEVEGTIMFFGGDDAEGTKYVFESVTQEVNSFASKTKGIGQIPVDAEGKAYDKTLKNVPTQGTFYKFVPTKDGQLDVTVGLEKGKTLIVTEDGEAIIEEKQAANFEGPVTFPVEATKTYLVFASDAELEYFGFNFTPTNIDDNNIAKDIATFKLLPAAEAGKADRLMLNDAVVTYIKGDNVFVEDASGAIDFYQTKIQFYVGQKLNGYIEGSFGTVDNLPVLNRVDGKTTYATFKVTEKITPEPSAITIADVTDEANVERFTKLEFVEMTTDRQGFAILADPNTDETVRYEDHFNVFYETGGLMEKIEGIVGINSDGEFVFWPTSKEGVVASDGYKKGQETELDVTNKSEAKSKNNPVVGISLTLDGACNAGSGSSMAGAMTSKGYKLRTANGSPVKESATFTVNEGKIVYDMVINGVGNYKAKDETLPLIKVTKVEVDGNEVSFEGGEFPAKGAADCGTLTLKDINATQSIVLYFDNSNAEGTQINMTYAVNYGEKVLTSKEKKLLAEAKELAKDRDAIAVGCLDDAIEAAEAGNTEGLEAAVNKFKADNASSSVDFTNKVGKAVSSWNNVQECPAGEFKVYTSASGVDLVQVFGVTGEGDVLNQEITGLENGTYNIGLYATSHNAWDGKYGENKAGKPTLQNDANNVAYVYGTSGNSTVKTWITARRNSGLTANEPEVYKVNGVKVADGKLTIGLSLAKAAQTEWHSIQIESLRMVTTAKEAYAAEKANLQVAIDDAEELLAGDQIGGKAKLQTAVDAAKDALVSIRLNVAGMANEVSKLKAAMEKFHASGRVYIQNVRTGKYLAAGGSWGTQVILNETGLDYGIENNENGTKNFESQVSNGGASHYLNTDPLFNDQPAYGWTVEQLANGNYTIFNGTQYLSAGDDDLAALTDNADEWRFITIDERIEAMAAATSSAPVNATFLIKGANFSRNDGRNNSWTKVTGNPTLSGGNNINNVGESYMAAYEIKQTLTDLPNGTYTLTAQAAVTYHDNRTIKEYDGQGAPVIYAGDQTTDFLIMDTEDQLSNMSQMGDAFTNGKYQTAVITVTVTDGTLTIGTKCERADIWAIWDNFQLMYYGNGGTPTAVKEIETVAEPVRFEDGAIYNLRGQKMEGTLKPGLYIKNGKKIIIR